MTYTRCEEWFVSSRGALPFSGSTRPQRTYRFHPPRDTRQVVTRRTRKDTNFDRNRRLDMTRRRPDHPAGT